MKKLFALVGVVVAAVGIVLFAAFHDRIVPPKSVEDSLRAQVAKDPANVDARIRLADVLIERKAVAEAMLLLKDGLTLEPNNQTLLRANAQKYAQWAEAANDPKRYGKAAECWEQLIQSGVGDVDTQVQLARALLDSEQYGRAAKCTQTALNSYPDHPALLIQSGRALKKVGKYERALPLLLKATEQSPQDFEGWRWLAATQQCVGDYAGGAANMQEALLLCPEAARSDFRGYVEYARELLLAEPSPAAFFSHYWLAHKMLSEENRPDRAAAEFEACLKVQTLTDPRIPRCVGCAHERIALFRAYVDDPDGAVHHVLEAIKVYKAINQVQDLAYAFEGLAQYYGALARKHTDQKNDYLQQEVAAREEQLKYAKLSGNDHLGRHGLAEKAEALFELYGVADDRLKECRKEMAPHIPAQGPVTDCSIASVIYYESCFRVAEKDFPEAERLLLMLADYFGGSKAVEVAKMGPAVWGQLACLAWERNDYDAAIAYGEKAARRLSALRNRLGADDFRRRVGGRDWNETYANLIAYATKKGDTSRAFNYSEQYKARALLDLLGTKGESDSTQVRRLAPDGPSGPGPEAGTAQVQGGITPTGTRDLDIEQTSYARLPENTSAAAVQIPSFENAASFTLGQLQALMSDLTFVTYIVGKGGTNILVATGDKVQAVSCDGATEGVLREEIETFRKALGLRSQARRDLAVEKTGGREPVSAEHDLEVTTQRLYEQLIVPVLPYLATKTVCISPDGILNFLPFEALGKDGKFLLDDYAIFYAPSASVLKLCLDRNRHAHQSILAVGNPNLQNPAFRLFNAEDEVIALRDLFTKADVFVGDAATETCVVDRAGTYDVLHFACHAELNLDDPMLTSLRLAPDDKNDGYLHAGEVFGMNLQASLVVLSACNTGLGELTSGNELMGLTRSFLYAGAPAILASLWTVDDQSTAFLMQEFYRNLASMNKAEALRQAKLTTMKKYPSPFYWAAFCLQGDYR